MKKLFLISIMALGLASCNKKEAVDLKFDVSTAKTSYKAGDTVVFKISGNPDQLTFYSGEVGKVYAEREGITVEGNGGVMNLTFNVMKRYGSESETNGHPNTLQLYMTQNFDEKYTVGDFKEENWVNVSSKFTIPGIASTDVYTSSGTVSLYDMGLNLDRKKPVYFAFKYQTRTEATQTHPRVWIQQFNIESVNKATGDLLPISAMTSMGWKFIKFSGTITPTNDSNGLRFPSIAAPKEGSKIWAVSKGISLADYINVTNVNRGVALKNMSTRKDEHPYVYKQPGTYKVTFVASNENVYGGDKVVKELEIVVNP